MKKRIIPIFVPHRGCPHDCIFCNKKVKIVDNFLVKIKYLQGEVAFVYNLNVNNLAPFVYNFVHKSS